MRPIAAALLLGLVLVGAAVADEEPQEQLPKPLTPEQAADAVLDALQAPDEDAVKALAEKDDPDPWLVADELCYRGEHDAATVLAKAAPRKAVEGLPAYVASRRGIQPDEEARKALAAMMEALGKEMWTQALEAAKGRSETLDAVVRIRIAYCRGLALRSLKQHGESEEVLTRVGEAARDIGWLTPAALTFHQVGLSAASRSDWKKATSAWKSRLRIERALGDRSEVAGTLANIGILLEHLGEYAEALECQEESLKIYSALGDRAGIATALNNIGVVQKGLGSYAKAIKCYQESLKIYRAFGNQAAIAGTLGNIGVVQEHLGNYPEALKRYHASLKLVRALGDESGIARTLNNIGVVQRRLGGYAKAFECHEASLEIYDTLGDRAGISAAFHNLGMARSGIGEHQKALKCYTASLEISRALGNQAGIAVVLHDIGVLQYNLGDFPEALRSYEASLKIQRTLGNPAGIADTLHNIGNVQGSLGNHLEALRGHEASLKAFRELRNQAGVAAALNNIGVVQQRLGAYGAAQAAYELAHRALDDSPSLMLRAAVLCGEADVHMHQSRYGNAVAAARRGVTCVADLSGGLAEAEGPGAREVFSGLYDTGLRAARHAGQPEDLLWFLEQGRAGSLREALGSRAALEAAVIPTDLRMTLTLVRHGERLALEAYRKAVARGNRKAARSTERAWQEAQAEVGRVSARIQREAKAAAAIALSAPDDVETIQGGLRSGEALLLFGLTSEEAVGLVIRKDAVRMVVLPASKEIETAADALLEDDRHIAPDRVPALRKLLVDPLNLGEDVKRVLVSPTGRLGYVPFALLFPLQEVVYVPSGTTYGLLLDDKRKRGQKILALGDPDYVTQLDAIALRIRAGNAINLAPLPATRKEVEAIADTCILGKGATETALQGLVKERERWRAVHFACHGLVDPERPMLSALALTADHENDGFLTALEIFRMTIPADLVVLSACETGKGKIYKTEGIVGLTRAFMFAGAPRVICSLWNVDDEATQALMIRFYELWNPKDGSKGLGAAAALKKSQQHVRDDVDHPEWKHPYYWAAWVLWGLPD